MKTIAQVVAKEVARATARAAAMVRRGVLGGGVSADNTGKVGGPGGDDFEGVESWQHYGFRSRPPVSGEVLLVVPYGRGEGAIICAEHDRAHVPSCAASEVVVYGASAAGAQALIRLRPDGSIWLTPGGASFIDAGAAGTSIDFALKGTTFDVANRILVGGLFAGFTAAGVGFTAVGTVMGVLAGDPALATATKNACTTCGTAMGVAAGACTTAAGLCTAFLAGSYLATKLKVS